jgi:PKD repeat protein
MKKTLAALLLTGIVLFSCSEDEKVTPLEPDFSLSINGKSPNAKLAITNNSKGATSYNWTLSEGAIVTSSTKQSPEEIQIEKAGELTVKLVVSNGSEQKEITKTIVVEGSSAILTFSDVEFALTAGDNNYGRLFSCETGIIYKDNEITESIGPKIHLAFGSMGSTMYYFESPTVADYQVLGATETKVINWEQNPTISTSEFDAMVDDSNLAALTIISDDNSFGNSSIPGTVLFETAEGKKGVIKTKAVNADRLLVDIKVQKY